MSMTGLSIYAWLIQFLFWIPLTILFLRIVLPVVRAPFSDPLVGWIYTVTNPVMRPFERFIPRWRNWSLTAILLFWVVACIEYALIRLGGSPLAWLIGGLGGAISFALGFLIALVVLYALFSLFQPRAGTSIVYLTERIAQPMCAVFRRHIPPLGPLDLSPAMVVLSLVLTRLLLTAALYQLAAKL